MKGKRYGGVMTQERGPVVSSHRSGSTAPRVQPSALARAGYSQYHKAVANNNHDIGGR